MCSDATREFNSAPSVLELLLDIWAWQALEQPKPALISMAAKPELGVSKGAAEHQASGNRRVDLPGKIKQALPVEALIGVPAPALDRVHILVPADCLA